MRVMSVSGWLFSEAESEVSALCQRFMWKALGVQVHVKENWEAGKAEREVELSYKQRQPWPTQGMRRRKGVTLGEAAQQLRHFLKGPIARGCPPTARPAAGAQPSPRGGWVVLHRAYYHEAALWASPPSLLPSLHHSMQPNNIHWASAICQILHIIYLQFDKR